MAKTKTTFRVLGEEAERPREEEVEERMEERVEDRDEETMVNIISNEIKQYMHQEHHIDDKMVKTKGFIGRAIARARLGGFLSAKSKNIYLVAVTEFLGYLDTEKLTTKVSCINRQTKETYKATVDIRKILTEKMLLRNSGKSVDKAGHWH